MSAPDNIRKYLKFVALDINHLQISWSGEALYTHSLGIILLETDRNAKRNVTPWFTLSKFL
jgi:hypothetical protein